MNIFVTGATGFVGTALRPVLLERGHRLRCTTRHLRMEKRPRDHEEWVEVDLLDEKGLPEAMRGMQAAYYLVHSMGQSGASNFLSTEQAAARIFAESARKAGIKRIIYLGGVIPDGKLSTHLESRKRVGEILRESGVPTLELRASMIIGNGSASWQIVRDLALRLPAMVLPTWADHVTRPVALEDVLVALERGLKVPLRKSAWFDIPGPETLSARAMFETVAAIRGRALPSLRVPLLGPRLSAYWLRFVTRADQQLASELVQGFTKDLLPVDSRYWELIKHQPEWTFEDAARHALATEDPPNSPRELLGWLEELAVDLTAPRIPA